MGRSAASLDRRRDGRRSLVGPLAQQREWSRKSAHRPSFGTFRTDPHGFCGEVGELCATERAFGCHARLASRADFRESVTPAAASFAHLPPRSPSAARRFREGYPRSTAARRTAAASFAHYATQSRSESRQFRAGSQRFAAGLRIVRASFAHYAHRSPRRGGDFREGLSCFASLPAAASASQSRTWPGSIRVEANVSHPVGNPDLPIGEIRRRWPTPLGGDMTSAQRSPPTRHVQRIR
jgi:hypothetical protein